VPQKVKTVEVLSSAARMKLWHSDWREVFAMAVAVVEAHDRGLRAIARIGVSIVFQPTGELRWLVFKYPLTS